MDKTLIKAMNKETLEVYEVISIELWQGDVTYVQLMDKHGDMFEIDDPEGLEYSMKTTKQRGDYNNK